MPISYKRTNSMKLEYQVSELRREDKWNCNFCPFERERSLTATYKIVSYNRRSNNYNDIAYICIECKEALNVDTLFLLVLDFLMVDVALDLTDNLFGFS